jgi:hypothetical protein
MPSSQKSAMNCEEYSHMPNLYEFCETTFGDEKPNKKDINDFMNSFNFSDISARNELKDKIFNYLLKKKKDFLQKKKDYTKSEINKEVIHYLDLAIQFLLEKKDLEHLILIYFSSMEKEILLNKDKFRKRVYLDFGYSKSDFNGDKFKKILKKVRLSATSLNRKSKKSSLPKRRGSLLNRRGSLPNRRGSLPNLKKTKKSNLPKKSHSAPERLSLEEGVYSTSYIEDIIEFFDEYVMTYIHMNEEVIDNLEDFNTTYGYWVTEIKKLEDNTIKKEFVNSLVKKNIVGVIIPSRVTSIGENAFRGCNLATVTIPDSVTSIREYAFYGCSSLVTVTFPATVTSIGRYAFFDCGSLAQITIPDSVTNIGEFAFNGCRSLATVTFPATVTSIGGGAFWGCDSLKTAIILNSRTTIGRNCFQNSTRVIRI